MMPLMIATIYHSSNRWGRAAITALCILTLGLMFAPLSFSAEERTTTVAIFPAHPGIHAGRNTDL